MRSFKIYLILYFLSGDAGVVKRDALKTRWLSAYEGSNPSSRISIDSFKS